MNERRAKFRMTSAGKRDGRMSLPGAADLSEECGRWQTPLEENYHARPDD
jgi:hypothetical protein